MEPPQRVRQDQRERDVKRQVRSEQVEPHEQRLAIRLLERVDERPRRRLDDRLAGGERPHPDRVLDDDLGEVNVAHDGAAAVPVEDGRPLHAAEQLDRHVARGAVDEHVPAATDPRRVHAVEHHDVEALHAAAVRVRRPQLEGHLGIGAELLLEKQVAGGDEEDRDLARRREHGVGDVVGDEIVGHVEAGGDDATALVAERDHHGAPDVGPERQRFRGQGLPVELERERERLLGLAEVDERQERLVLEAAEVVLADREARDPDVVAPPSDPVPPDTRVAEAVALRRRMGPVGEHLDLGMGVVGGEGARGPDGLGQAARDVVRLGAGQRGGRPVVVAAQRGADARVDAGLDDDHLGAETEPVDQRPGLLLRQREARGRHVGGLHRRRGVEHHDDLPRPVAEDGRGRPRQRQRQREQREELQDEERVALEALEGGRGLAVARRRLPQQDARHRALAASDLQEVEEQQRRRQREERERERRQEGHASMTSLS